MRQTNTDKEQIEVLYEIRTEITKEILRLEALVLLDAHFMDQGPDWLEQTSEPETVVL